MVLERQIRGIIALTTFLAFIPLFCFFYDPQSVLAGPDFSVAGRQKIAVEVRSEVHHTSIFFVDRELNIRQLFQQIFPECNVDNDTKLVEGMSIHMEGKGQGWQIGIQDISAAKRLALGLPVDINTASYEDLTLISGIGDSTAQKIISRRQEIGRFKNMEQLKEIKGIKDKKLSKLMPHLYIKH